MSLDRERRFWDREAAGREVAALRSEARFVAEEPLWAFLLAAAQARSPRRVLDLGCGRGATTLLLGERFPDVVGTDLSEQALLAARRLHGATSRSARLVVSDLSALPFADGAFDLVVGRFVLHHAPRLDEAAREVARVLAPGGAGVFVETWGQNPVLRLGREVVGLLGIGMGTEDERPLTADDVRLLEAEFAVAVEFPVFTAFTLLDRVFRRLKPLAARSPVFRTALGRAWARSQRLDRALEARLPWIRPWGHFVGLLLEKR